MEQQWSSILYPVRRVANINDVVPPRPVNRHHHRRVVMEVTRTKGIHLHSDSDELRRLGMQRATM